MFIIHPDVEKYLENLIRQQPFDEEILKEMEDYAAKNKFPIVERQVGLLLYLITKIKKPKLVVEVGSGYGYSAYWFGKGIEDGKVILTDYQQKNIDMAKNFLKKANLVDRVEFRVGDGLQIATEYKNIDILFLDLEKSRYLEAIQQVENNLNSSSLVIADNVLWYGKVVENQPDQKTQAIKEFNEYMVKSGKFISTIIPVRDGVLVALKV